MIKIKRNVWDDNGASDNEKNTQNAWEDSYKGIINAMKEVCCWKKK